MLANMLAYCFNVVVSRSLGPDGYGELGALLGLVIVAAVPAVALQAVVARRLANADTEETPRVAASLLKASLAVGGAATLVLLVLAPVVAAYLRLDLSAALWLAISLLPLTIVHAELGVLQGRQRFGAFSVLLVAAAVLRLAAGATAAAHDGETPAVLAATTFGGLVSAGVGALLLRSALPALVHTVRPKALVVEVSRAAIGLLALATLANIDVVLARHHLSARDAGLYAVGSLFAKAAFWAPQVVVVVVFPRLAGSGSRLVLNRAVAVLAGCGAVLTFGTWLLADPVVVGLFGADYGRVAPLLWGFTAMGALLAVGQLLVYEGIATQRALVGVVVALAAALEVVVITLWVNEDMSKILSVALAAAAAVVVVNVLHGATGAISNVRIRGGRLTSHLVFDQAAARSPSEPAVQPQRRKRS